MLSQQTITATSSAFTLQGTSNSGSKMDHTQLFLATVKTIRLRLKAQRRDNGQQGKDSNILTKSVHKPTEFAQEAKDVALCITKLQDFLLKYRKDYINSIGHLISHSSSMTDSERDLIDSDAQTFIQNCSERIQKLHTKVSAARVGQQSREHRQVVYESLGEYLKAVCKLYSEQRAIRVKRVVSRKRTARLQPVGLKKSLLEPSPTVTDAESPPGESTETGEENEETTAEEGYTVEALLSTLAVTTPDPEPLSTDTHLTGEHHENGGLMIDPGIEGLSEEERAMFEQENEQIFAEMNTMVDEVRQIEGKVIEISRLQEVFAEKVLEQAKQLDIVSDQTVTASENVTGGNEQIRQAIKNKASFRLWILFILIMCSLSLLFLDWYS